MILEIVGGVALVFVILVVYTAIKIPKVVIIRRSQLIKATPEKIFPYINNSRLIQDWNPFIEGDTAVVLTYAGVPEGIGAEWAWDGSKSGAGKATITESIKHQRVAVRLDFKRPFHVTNYGEYSLAVHGAESEVTWLINESAFIPRALSVYMNLDAMIGKEFAKGLLKLKALAEV